MEEKINAAVYIRVSTEDQAREGYSLDEQERRIKEYCKYKEINIYKIFREEGKSAKNTEGRPMFNKMLEEMENNKFNAIVIYKLDRFTRSIVDLDNTLKKMEKKKCDLMSVTEEINTSTAFGKFFVRIIVLLAQLEIEQTSERTIMGLEGAVKEGVYIGQAPLGYKRYKDKKLVIFEEEALTIRKIFNLYLKGYSYYYIAKLLIAEGNLLRKWKDNIIQKIINNKVYCGDIEHRKTEKDKEMIIFENVVPAIVSKDIFNECQMLIEKNKQSFGSSLTYMFGKTLYCHKCGALLKVSTAKDKGIKHYVCDRCKNFNEKKIEEALLNEISNIAEFNMALTYNAIIVDNDRLTEILNNIEVNAPDERLKENKEEIRTLLDDIIIKEKENNQSKLWNELNYEEKRQFINDNIEAIYIEKIKGSTQQNYKVKISRIKFKTSRLNLFFDLINKGVIDSVFSKGNKLFSMAVIKEKDYVDKYIESLKKRYNINIEEEVIRFDAAEKKSNKEDNVRRYNKLNNDNLFKVIRMPRSRKNDLREKLAIERYIYISLND